MQHLNSCNLLRNRIKPIIEWDKTTLSTGIFATLKSLKHFTQLFYIEASTSHPMVIATNSLNRQSAEHVCNICAQRWKIEQLHLSG